VGRLSDTSLLTLPDTIARPRYNRADVQTGIVHLGIGAFHRAHQAVMVEACLNAGDLRWGVLGASLRSPAVSSQLNPQGGLYTCHVKDGADTNISVIGALRGVIVAPENPSALIEGLAASSVKLVSLTITEKGYCLDPNSGRLLLDDPILQQDIKQPQVPQSAYGFLLAALALRRARKIEAFTVLSCDNIAENGKKLGAALVDFASQADAGLAGWIQTNVTFPSTMVDRIVPAVPSSDIDTFEAVYGVRDEGLVSTEPFSQWVIENRFSGVMPDFEHAGAQYTNDVQAWETAKLRLLNGAHSAMAYLGALAGFDYIHQVIAQPAFVAFIEDLHIESASTFQAPKEMDVEFYCAQLLDRFRNSSLQHKTRQIALDGSQKIPQRLLAAIRVKLERGEAFNALAFALAGWMRWQSGIDEIGQAFEVKDPLAVQTRAVFAHGGSPTEIVQGLCAIEAIFGTDLVADSRFVHQVSLALDLIVTRGVLGGLRQMLNKSAPK
jgi:fructuronate reductase